MVHYRIHSMGFITGFLKALFIILFGLTALGLIGAGIVIYPDPESAVMVGTGSIVILMLWVSWMISPVPSWPS